MMPNIRSSGSMSISGQPADHVPMLVPDRKNNASYGYKPTVSYEMTTLRNASSPKREGYGDPSNNARSSSMKSDPVSISGYDDVTRKSYDEEYNYKKLVEAIASRNLCEIKQLLNQGLDIYFKMHDGNTPYGAATQTGDLDLIKYLQKYVCDQRNYSPKQMEQKHPIYQDLSYHSQSRVHPLHSRDHNLASLSLLPSSNMISQPPMGSSRLLYPQYAQAQPQTLEARSFMNPYARSLAERSYNQYSFDHTRETNQHDNIYGLDRMPMNYTHSNQPGVAHISSQGTVESNIMSKTALSMYHGQYQDVNRNIGYGDMYTSSHNPYKQDRGTRDSCPAPSSLRHRGTNSPVVLDAYHSALHTSLNNSYSNSFTPGFYKNHQQNSMKCATPELAKPPAQSSVKSQDMSIIDLTKCNSPEVQANNLPLYPRESASNTYVVPPPLMYTSNNDIEDRFRNMQPSIDQWQKEHASGYRKSPYSSCGSNQPNSLPQYVSTPDFHRPLLPFHPTYGYPPTLPAVDPTAFYEQKHWEDSLNYVGRAGNVSNSPLGKLANRWAPQRYLTPSPHPFTSLEHSRKKNDSPSLAIGVKSKTLPQLTSDLTFNYPESNKTEYSTLSKYAGIDNGILKKDFLYPPANNKLMGWMSSDDSKLSPFENELLDSAARDKSFNKRCSKVKPAVHVRNADVTPARTVIKKEGECKKQASFRNAYEERKRKADATKVNGDCVAARNSVIKTVSNFNAAPAHCDPPRNVPTSSASRTDLSRAVNDDVQSAEQAERNTDADVTLDFNGSSQENGDECVSVHGSDAAKHYVPGDDKFGNIEGIRSEEQYLKKRKLSVARDPNNKAKKKCIAGAETNCQERTSDDDIHGEVNSEKRRPRRSGDMDEYLYGWDPFSDEDTENDDSSDEDYNCPQLVPKTRVYRAAAKVRTTRRTASMKSITKELSDNDILLEDDIELKTARKSTPVKVKTKKLRKTPEKPKEKVKRKRIKSKLYINDDDSDSDLDESRKTESNHAKLNHDSGAKSEPIEEEKDSAKPEKDIVTDEHVGNTKISVEVEPEEHELVEAVRKKRKYSKSKDRDEITSKKSKKIKTPTQKSLTKIKKYKKLKNKSEVSPQINCKIPSAISPSLVKLYTSNEGKHKLAAEFVPLPRASADFKDQECDANSVSERPVSPGSKEAPENKRTTSNTSQPNTQQTVSSPENKTKKRLEKSECKDVSSIPKKTNSETAYPDKVKKKPGRKPGPKKIASVQQNIDKQGTKKDEKTLNKKSKKSKKSKGDGLPRFGMRKKNRGNKAKSNKSLPFKTKEKLNSVKTSSSDKQDPVNRSLDFSADDCKREKGDVKSKGNERSVLGPASEFTASGTNSIVSSKLNDLKSDVKLPSLDDFEHSNSSACGTARSSVKDEGHPCTSSSFYSIKKEYMNDFETEFGQSQSSERNLANHTPIPLNFKKVWCNSAIGETQLHKAARYGYNDNLLYYLQRGFNVKQCDNAGYTALHEACVTNNLESASLLLQYGADVNKNANDGTRPLHDAVEYDHIEMTRLMLAAGADPMLSKFSGRSVSNMIYSKRMGKFIQIYLEELAEEFDESFEDEKLTWNLPCSEIFDKKKKPHEYDVLGDPPAENSDNQFEFELFDHKPAPTYSLQPDDDAKRQNFYLLDDYLDATAKRKSSRNRSIRIHAMNGKKFLSQAKSRLLSRKNIPSDSSSFIELVAASNTLSEAMGAEIVSVEANEKRIVDAAAIDSAEHTELPECNEKTDLVEVVSSALPVDHKDSQSTTSTDHDKDLLLSIESEKPAPATSTTDISADDTSSLKGHLEQMRSQCILTKKNNKPYDGCTSIQNSVCCSVAASESTLHDLEMTADSKLSQITSTPVNGNDCDSGRDRFVALCHSACNNEITKAKMDDPLELCKEQPLASVS